jgi:hypothetical protein
MSTRRSRTITPTNYADYLLLAILGFVTVMSLAGCSPSLPRIVWTQQQITPLTGPELAATWSVIREDFDRAGAGDRRRDRN